MSKRSEECPPLPSVPNWARRAEVAEAKLAAVERVWADHRDTEEGSMTWRLVRDMDSALAFDGTDSVCDVCMRSVMRIEVWDPTDGEHVICNACALEVLNANEEK